MLAHGVAYFETVDIFFEDCSWESLRNPLSVDLVEFKYNFQKVSRCFQITIDFSGCSVHARRWYLHFIWGPVVARRIASSISGAYMRMQIHSKAGVR